MKVLVQNYWILRKELLHAFYASQVCYEEDSLTESSIYLLQTSKISIY